MAIKLTKNEQKVQKDRLKQYQRYLPTLQLKKQQLQQMIMKTRAELEQKEAEERLRMSEEQFRIERYLRRGEEPGEPGSAKNCHL